MTFDELDGRTHDSSKVHMAAGWIVLALMIVAMLLVLFNTITSSSGHNETGMVLTAMRLL
jgi:hypothetical protein